MQTDIKISILGCGWLGLPLAEKLVQLGFQVKGSTTTPAKLNTLAATGLQPYLIHLEKATTQTLADFLRTDMLIISFPPKIRAGKGAAYVNQINILKQAIQQASLHNILFISSTAVYPDVNTTVTETLDIPDSLSPNYLREAEELIRNTQVPTTILRLAGLVGLNRHPGRFFAGKENVPNPQGPVNLIHLDDCLQVILEIIKQNKCNQVYNACADEHPSRKEFYTAATAALNLPLPHFAAPSPADTFKIISSEKLKKELQYRFIYPDPMLFKEVLLKNREV